MSLSMRKRMSSRVLSWSMVCLTLPVLAGCMPEMTMEDLKAMKTPRPAELDRLNAFAGTWHGTGTANMMGMKEPLKVEGTSKAEWQADGWFLVEHSEFKMGDMDPMKGIGLWTYDPKSKCYRSFFFDTMGARGSAKVKYDEANQTWTMKVKGTSPMGSTRGKGTIHMSKDTMDWTWEEYPSWDVFGMIRIVEFSGTSKRK